MSNPQPTSPELTVEPLFRPIDPVEGVPLVFKQLSMVAANGSGLIIPGSEQALKPQVPIVRGSELSERAKALSRLDLQEQDFIAELIHRIPDLGRPRALTATDLDIHPTKGGSHFLSLRFDEEGQAKLFYDRDSAWHELANIARTRAKDLHWRPGSPNMPVAILGNDVRRGTVDRLARHVRSQLPLRFTAAPLFDPNDK